MSNINELNQKIAILNADSQRVNNERAVNIGKHDTLSKQLDAAIKSYNEKYGKNITVETLEQEINAVTSAKEKEIADIEAVLNAIKSGDYAKANELSNGVSGASEPTQVEPAQVAMPAQVEPVQTVATPAQITTPVTEPAQTVATPAQVVTPPVVSEPIAPPVVEPMISEPITPPVVEPIAPPMVEPAQVTPPPVVTPPPMVEPVTPPPLMPPPPVVTPPPVTTEAPKSFSAILGGTAFGQ